MDPVLAKYDHVRHVGSAIIWNGCSYMNKPGEVVHSVNENKDLVVHYYNTNTTVTHYQRKGLCNGVHASTMRTRMPERIPVQPKP